MKICGKLVDIHNRDIYSACINIVNDRIESIERTEEAVDNFIMPGLIDSHIHIESSMITPGAFALAAVRHGTIAVVTDPHEIANVLGVDGVMFMLKDSEKTPLHFWFGVPSCVPATAFESNGAVIGHMEVEKLLKLDEMKYLSEMMNFPGVIYDDPEVMSKIECARKLGKPVDGHAPGLAGDSLRKYINAGISTDHECCTIEEAREKISCGMKILIREGSAARNLDSLKDLFKSNPDSLMLCSDDLHPEMLRDRHINKLIGKLIKEGYYLFDVIRSATINPNEHYRLEAGMLKAGDKADFIIVNDPACMDVLETWIGGKKVFGDGDVKFSYEPAEAINKFNCTRISTEDILVANRHRNIRVIEAFEGELLTKEIISSSGKSDFVDNDIKGDILKIVVKDRYNNAPPAVGFIKGFALKKGAFASSIAHDSHNIISVGTNDADIVNAINEVIRMKGGLAVTSGQILQSLQLNIAGIMTTRSCEDVATDYESLNKLVQSFGCPMKAPFMTLSFMALLVIPDLKIGDKGLFDVKKFEQVSLFVSES